jgi:hypothetical protein
MSDASRWSQALKFVAEAVVCVLRMIDNVSFPFVLMFKSLEGQVRKVGNNKGAWKIRIFWPNNISVFLLSVHSLW